MRVVLIYRIRRSTILCTKKNEAETSFLECTQSVLVSSAVFQDQIKVILL